MDRSSRDGPAEVPDPPVQAVRAGIPVQSADEPFTHSGRAFAGGTAFIRLAGQPEGTAAQLQAIARQHGAELVPISETWTESGISLGSGRVVTLRAPKVLLAWDTPASSLSAGWARYVLERNS